MNRIKQKKENNINKIWEKKENDSEVSIRKDEIQHKNEGSFQKFWESQRRTRYKASIEKNSDIYLPNPIAQTKNLLLKIDGKAISKEEFANESERDNEDSYYEVNITTTKKQMRLISTSAVAIYKLLMIELKIFILLLAYSKINLEDNQILLEIIYLHH